MSAHLQSYIVNHELKHDSTLHVIGVISNPVRFHSRYRLFNEWVKDMLRTPNVKLHVVESVFGERFPECSAKQKEYNYLQVHTKSEIWLKENLINLAVKNLLPRDWKYMAWVDCDVHFRNPNWALASIHQLQHYNIIQPWQSAMDLDFHGNVMATWTSFGSLIAQNKPIYKDKTRTDLGYTYGHTGYAWACNRYFYENVHKLADWNIVGAGDHMMAWGCLNKVDTTMPRQISHGYRALCEDWQRRAHYACAGLVGFTPGRLEHNWHGSKTRRQYWNRWEILTKNHYDPRTDLAYDSQGVLTLCGKNKYAIEHAIMRYNRERMEDSIDNV